MSKNPLCHVCGNCITDRRNRCVLVGENSKYHHLLPVACSLLIEGSGNLVPDCNQAEKILSTPQTGFSCVYMCGHQCRRKLERVIKLEKDLDELRSNLRASLSKTHSTAIRKRPTPVSIQLSNLETPGPAKKRLVYAVEEGTSPVDSVSMKYYNHY